MDSIIFDVDGTLWNSTEIVARSWTEYLQNTEGLDIVITSERLMALFGRLMPDVASKLFSEYPEEEQLRLLRNCCEAENAALLHECPPLYEDLGKALEILSKKYSLFIVSNCQGGYIEVLLETTGFESFFQGHLCPDDTGKDKAGNIRQVIEDFHLEHPVYVGDTMGDFQACRKAGVPFVFAAYGFGDVPEPDAVIQKPMDLTTLDL